jgi:Lrp/AsnC family transcriptional regulator, leucine-responsive regulatory protein
MQGDDQHTAHPKTMKIKPILTNGTVEIDDFDRKILELVQRDNTRPLHELSKSVNLSAPAIARRLQKLRQLGVISRDVSIVSGNAVGRPLTLIVQVSVDSELMDQIDAIKQRFSNCPQIQHCYYVTGDADFILIINVRDMEEYEQLTRSLFFEGGNVRHFRTFVAMQKVKVDDYVIVDNNI